MKNQNSGRRLGIVLAAVGIFMTSGVARAEGLNTGFDANHWRRVRAAKQIPDAATVQRNQATIADRTNQPIRNQRATTTGVAVSSPEVCAEMEEQYADLPCSFVPSCRQAYGLCTTAQKACTNRACVAANRGRGAPRPRPSAVPVARLQTGSGQPISISTQVLVGVAINHMLKKPALSITQEARRMLMGSGEINVELNSTASAAWHALGTGKLARAEAHANWVYQTDGRQVASAADLVSEADRLLGTASATARLAPGVRATLNLSLFPIEENVDYPGNDIVGSDLDSPDPHLCAAMCTINSRCVGFTFVDAGAQGARAKCYLKSAMSASGSSNSHTVSGKYLTRYQSQSNASVMTPERTRKLAEATSEIGRRGARCRNWDLGTQKAYCEITVRSSTTWACPGGFNQDETESPYCMRNPGGLPGDWERAEGCSNFQHQGLNCNRFGFRHDDNTAVNSGQVTSARLTRLREANDAIRSKGSHCRNWDNGTRKSFCQMVTRDQNTWACPGGYQQHEIESPYCLRSPTFLPPNPEVTPGCGTFPHAGLDCNRYGIRYD